MNDKYILNYDSLREQEDKIYAIVSKWIEELDNIDALMNNIIDMSGFEGDKANSIKLYLKEVHSLGFLDVMKDLLSSILSQHIIYVNGFYDSVDDNIHTKASKEELDIAINDIKVRLTQISELTSKIDKKMNSISDILECSQMSHAYLMDSLGETSNILNNFNKNVLEYEETKYNSLSCLEQYIGSTRTLLNTVLNQDKTFMTGYITGTLMRCNGYNELSKSIYENYELQNNNADKYKLAVENDTKVRDEVYDELVQQRKDEATLEIIAGVGALAGAIVFTVCTAGAGAPTIVLAASAITGAAAAGIAASNITEGVGSYYLASQNDITTRAINPMRDTLFCGNQEAYDNFSTGVNVSMMVLAPTAMITGSASGFASASNRVATLGKGMLINGAEGAVVDKALTTGVELVGDEVGMSDMDKKKLTAAINSTTAVVSAARTVKYYTKNVNVCGDPINVATGGFMLENSDIIIEDIAEEFYIGRRYDSVDTNPNWIGGKRWLFNIESSIASMDNKMVVLMPDGHVERFIITDNGYTSEKSGNEKYILSGTDNGFRVDEAATRKKYDYDETGRIICITDKNNNRTEFEYAEKLSKILFTSGQYVNITYKDNYVETIVDSAGRGVRYEYDKYGYMTRVIHNDGTYVEYEYSIEGMIKAIVTEEENRFIDNEYDLEGRVVLQKLANGECFKISYDDENKTNSFYQVSTDKWTHYTYNEYYEVILTKQYDGSEEKVDFDKYGNIIRKTDRRGGVHTYEYDIKANLIREGLPEGLNIYREYDTNNFMIHIYDNAKREEYKTYDERGNIILSKSRIDSESWNVRRYAYDDYGRIILEEDSNGHKRTCEYNTMFFRPSSVINRAGQVTSYEYDRIGRCIKEVTDMEVTTYEYDKDNNILKKTDGEGNTTRYMYTRTGKLKKHILPQQYYEKGEDGDGKIYEYNIMDELIKVTNALGAVRYAKRNTIGKIAKEISPNYYNENSNDGYGLTYEYDKDENQIRTIRPDGSVVRVFYDASNNIIKKVNSDYYDAAKDDGAGYRYVYDKQNRLTQVIDPEENIERQYIYDKAGNVIKEITAKGYDLGQDDESRKGNLYTYNLQGRMLSKREYVREEETGYRLTTFEYDLEGRLIKETNYLDYQTKSGQNGRVRIIHSEYDEDGRITRIKDSTGALIEYTYNAQNKRATRMQKINEHTISWERYVYDKAGRIIETQISVDKRFNESGRATIKILYDRNDNITRVITPAGNEIRKIYDADNNMISEEHIGKDGRIRNKTIYEYDAVGNVVTKTNKFGAKHSFGYDAMNRMIKEIDESGSITLRMYNANDNVIREIKANELESCGKKSIGWHYVYDVHGRIIEKYAPDKTLVFRRKYNKYSELIDESDAVGSGTMSEYDYGGRRIRTVTRSGIEQRFIYDVQGSIVCIQSGKPDKNNYSTMRNTQFEVDEWGRIKTSVAADGTVESYEYDYAGNIVKAVNGEGGHINYVYNEINKLSAITYQNGEQEHYAYDEEGNIAIHVDRNKNIVHYSHNMYGAITSKKEKKTGISQKYEYDDMGQLKSAFAQGMRYDYEYDMSGRLTAKKVGGRLLIGYAYDRQGNKIAQKDITGKVTTYSYDLLDRIVSVHDKTTELAKYIYYPDGKIKQVATGKNIITAYRYDVDKNITSLTTNIGKEKLVQNYYSYDEYGNCIRKDTLTGISTYRYDSNDRVVSVQYPSYSEYYYYDRAGNRVRHDVNSKEASFVENYSYNTANQLIESTRKNASETELLRSIYQYDANGNMINNQIIYPESVENKLLGAEKNLQRTDQTIYQYDGFNRMISAVKSDGRIQKCKYDAENLRYEMEENGKIVQFIFSEKEVVTKLSEIDSKRYIRGHEIIASDSEKAKTYYHYTSDERGSITHITEGDKIINCYEYDVFGNIIAKIENIENRFLYAGEQYDALTGQYYLRARFYNPLIARFTQEDTYHGDGLNLYTYCRNNPMKYVDPSGHASKIPATKGNCGISGGSVVGSEGGSGSFGTYSTKIDNKVTVIDKQELPSWLGKTFKDGNYRTVVTDEEIIVYRSFGYNAEAGGAFATSSLALNRIQTKIDSAILPEWKNTLRYEAEIVIPKGTTLNIGRVEEQFTMSGARLAGDADQFLLPENWDLNWIKNIREVRP